MSHAHFSCMVHYSLERKVANCFLNGLPPIKALLARHSPGKCQTMKPVTGMLRSEVAGAARPRGRGSVQNRCLRVHYLPKASVLEIMKLTVVLFNITDWIRDFRTQALGLQNYSNKTCQFCALLRWSKLAIGNDTSWFWLLLLLSLFMNPRLLFYAILIVFYLVPYLWGSENLNPIRHFWLSRWLLGVLSALWWRLRQICSPGRRALNCVIAAVEEFCCVSDFPLSCSRSENRARKNFARDFPVDFQSSEAYQEMDRACVDRLIFCLVVLFNCVPFSSPNGKITFKSKHKWQVWSHIALQAFKKFVTSWIRSRC